MITHAGEEHFLVVPTGDSVELSLLRGTRFLTSASRPISRPAAGAAESDSFLQAVKRLQASLSGQYTDVKVQSVLVAGEPGDEEMRKSLTEQFGAEVIYFDPIRSYAGRTFTQMIAERSPAWLVHWWWLIGRWMSESIS